MYAAVHTAVHTGVERVGALRPMALIALTDTLPTLLGGVFVVLAVIVLFSIVKAYTDSIARRMSSHRIVLEPRPHDDPGGMGVVYLLIGALLLAAWLMDGR